MSADGEPTSMIVVDDENDIRLMVKLLVESSGHFVVIAEAADGMEAIDVIREAAPSAPDVILLDNRMPRRTGLEVAREILSEDPGRVIVMFSAFVDDAVRTEAAELGIRAVVSKTDIDELPQILDGLLD